MALTEVVTPKGSVVITLFGEGGRVKTSRYVNNLVVGTGHGYLATRALGVAQPVMSHMALGAGTVAASISDTALGSQLGSRKVFGSVAQSGGNNQTLVYTTTFGSGEGTGTVTEAGVFNASTGGVMLCRTVFSAITKGAGDTLQITWTITLGV